MQCGHASRKHKEQALVRRDEGLSFFPAHNMDDKTAIEILERMLQKHQLDAREQEAVYTAIGILGWSKLMEGRIAHMKKARDKRQEIG